MADGYVMTLTERGFGFIRPALGGADVFFHRSVLAEIAFEELRPGDRVEYTLGADRHRQGVRATAVRPAKSPTPPDGRGTTPRESDGEMRPDMSAEGGAAMLRGASRSLRRRTQMIRIHHHRRAVIGTLGVALLIGVVQPVAAHAAKPGDQPRGAGHVVAGRGVALTDRDPRGQRGWHGSRDPRGAGRVASGRCRGTGHTTPTAGQGAGGDTSPGASATATPVIFGTLATPTPVTAASSVGTTGSVAALLTMQAQAASVAPALVKAVAWQESGWQMVTAADGGIGIMQLMPTTVTWVESALLGQSINPYDAAQNVRAGVAILRYYLSVFGNERLAIAAYHQGLQSVRSAGISAATAQYVASVLALQQRFA